MLLAVFAVFLVADAASLSVDTDGSGRTKAPKLLALEDTTDRAVSESPGGMLTTRATQTDAVSKDVSGTEQFVRQRTMSTTPVPGPDQELLETVTAAEASHSTDATAPEQSISKDPILEIVVEESTDTSDQGTTTDSMTSTARLEDLAATTDTIPSAAGLDWTTTGDASSRPTTEGSISNKATANLSAPSKNADDVHLNEVLVYDKPVQGGQRRGPERVASTAPTPAHLGFVTSTSTEKLPLAPSSPSYSPPSSTPTTDAEPSSPPNPFDPYRNWDSDSQERERELEERAREQNHPADDIEDSNVHEVNHFVPEDLQEEAATSTAEAGTRSVARWYLLLLAGNSTTVRLRQKDFAKYLKLNLAARLSVEYNDLRVNRVEFKPLLMVNVTIFSRPKDNEEVPLHMLADTNATLLELSGEEYHVVRFITIPSEHQEALASGFQSDSYSSVVLAGPRHLDMGVAVYFAIAAALGSILLAVFLVGLCRYLRGVAAEMSWRPWRRYKPIVFPRWSLPGLPLQHRLYADHIAQCAPLGREGRDGRETTQTGVWTTADEVHVQKILAPEPPRRLVFTPEPGQVAECKTPSVPEPACDPVPYCAPSCAPPCAARPNSKLSLFGSQSVVVQPDRMPLSRPEARSKRRLQPQGRHPLDVRIGTLSGSTRPTVLGLDNPNYMLQ